MNIKDFQDSLDYLFKAELTGFVWGHAGIGKSTVIKEYAKRKGYHFFPIYLGTQSDVGDILGLASFKKDANGSEVATTFAMPEWIKDTIDYCNANPGSGAILFLDEFNRARRDIINGMFSLALDKTFHTIKLPKNCHIIAAGNPPTDEYYTTDINETALMARFVHIKLQPTVNEWVEYAKLNKFEPTIISFVQQQPELLEDGKSSFTLPVKVDRRSYERLNRLFALKTPQHLLTQLMSGIIGIERVVAYEAHLGTGARPLTAENILLGERKEELLFWCTPSDIKVSLLTISSDNLYDELKILTDTKTHLNEAELENVFQYIITCPVDVIFTLVSKLHKNKSLALKQMQQDTTKNELLIRTLKDAKGIKQ